MTPRKRLAAALLIPLLIACAGCASKVAVHEDTKPEVISRIRPVYPWEMRKQGITGSVLVEFVIDVNGNTLNPIIKESVNPSFDAPALDAIKKWKFKPGTKNGSPIPTRVVQVLSFDLRMTPDPKMPKIPDVPAIR